MPRKTGKRIRLSNDRRLVCDIIELARRMPTAPITRTLDVVELSALRRKARPRISWQLIMMRAYALVARDFPQLRQVYAPWPWPHIYEHPESVCMMTVDREIEGEHRLFFARFCQPENYTLVQLQELFDYYRRRPITEIRHLAHQVQFASMPRWVRFFGWRLMTHLMPRSRAKQMGTFGMSLSGFRETKGVFHLGPTTTTLGYDQFCRDGKAFVTLTFDHRILDGKPAIDVLNGFDEVLHGQVKDELRMMIPSNRSVFDRDSSFNDRASREVGRSIIPVHSKFKRKARAKHPTHKAA